MVPRYRYIGVDYEVPETLKASFLEYCSVYWGVHAKRELSDCGRLLALEVLKENYGEVSTRLLLARVRNFYVQHYNTVSPFSGLHCASFFGIIEAVAGLIEMECYDINEGDFAGCAPLVWAAWNGHKRVVEILLGRKEINPDKPDNDGRHRSHVPLSMDMREYWECYSDGKRSTPTSRIGGTELRSFLLLRMDMRQW